MDNDLIQDIIMFSIIILVAMLFTMHATLMISDSMTANVNRGDILIVENADMFGISEFNPETDIKVGDIVSFTSYNRSYVDKVVDIKTENNTTYYAFDNLENDDNYFIESGGIDSKVIYIIPEVGKISLLFRGD